MNYREEVLRTINKSVNGMDRLNMAALGLAGETGEVVELVKKHLFHGKDLDKQALMSEISDVRWYLEVLAMYIDVTMDEVEQKNIEKLKKRYPQGFTHAASEARIDVKD